MIKHPLLHIINELRVMGSDSDGWADWAAFDWVCGDVDCKVRHWVHVYFGLSLGNLPHRSPLPKMSCSVGSMGTAMECSTCSFSCHGPHGTVVRTCQNYTI